ncbi:GH92 family glycosyl hydrolase [uncultured Alistipes sp.]|nr:GH92 family glycosyl hydrolase [uncultured Alistipes sp.]
MTCFRLIFALSALLTGISCGRNSQTDYTIFVDPRIGSGFHGHVFVGANVPNGMVQVGMTQISKGWDWCSGYHVSDTTVVGFAQMHLSGTGIGDLGDIALMPYTGAGIHRDGRLYGTYSHQREKVRPGYYYVHVDPYNIDADFTATERVALHRYRYNDAKDAALLIDLANGIGWDAPVDAMLVRESDTGFSGYRYSTGWARDQKVYFTMQFSHPVREFTLEQSDGTAAFDDGVIFPTKNVSGTARFELRDGETLSVKVALSPVSVENAKLNMAAEAPGWDFDSLCDAARSKWNDRLSCIDFQTEDTTVRKIFYTSLYHTMIAPSLFSDVNGDYRGPDDRVHHSPEQTYTTFSLWDTYRAAFPLISITDPQLARGIVRSFLQIAAQQGKLPVWHLVGNETDCMVGNPGICVLADFLLKGYVDPDRHDEALGAMVRSAMLDERDMNLLKEYGYIPYDKSTTYETVAKGLEYALADWCLAETAKAIGHEDTETRFRERSRSYRRYFDPATGFMRARSSTGSFREPFNPFRSIHMRDDYTEGNAWQYTWLVPHDVRGLEELFGSREAFLQKLDSLFIAERSADVQTSDDITGLIGQYAHGNEPSHHIAYIYAYAGRQWQTARLVRKILGEMYTATPEGICGNEDVGQMSAWYVLSAMGFYQVEPAGGRYILGSPLMDRAVITLPDGRAFEIHAQNNSPENCYIQQVELNGKAYNKFYITHADIVAGGRLMLEMGPSPNPAFGTEE